MMPAFIYAGRMPALICAARKCRGAIHRALQALMNGEQGVINAGPTVRIVESLACVLFVQIDRLCLAPYANVQEFHKQGKSHCKIHVTFRNMFSKSVSDQ